MTDTPALLVKKHQRANEIEKYGRTGSRGYREAAAFFKGKKLSPLQSIKAYCFDCMGYFADGAEDCVNPLCPLYPYMPYSPKTKDPVKVAASKLRAASTGFGKKAGPAR